MIKLEDVQRGYDAWAAKPHNAKWVRRIDGTPIQNDIVVSIFDALKAIAPQAEAKSTPVGFEAAWAAFQNCPIDGALDDEDNMRAALSAAIAIAPQAPVSAVPVAWQCRDRFGSWIAMPGDWTPEENVKGYAYRPLYASPPPAQADDHKDALIRELLAPLSWYVAFDRRDLRDSAKAALAKAKAAGYEP